MSFWTKRPPFWLRWMPALPSRGWKTCPKLWPVSYTQLLSGAVLDIPGEAAQPRPNAVILGYPVVTAGQYAHRGSFVQLAGSADPAAQQVFGLEDKITPQMPPVFVWTTMELSLIHI